MAPPLPTEIIRLFLEEIRPDASEGIASALAVSAVSPYWRALALSTPSLWSTFSFCLRAHDEAMLSAFFERSFPAPLHLVISFDFPHPGTVYASKVERALTRFLREADRIQHLHLRFLDTMHGQSDYLGQFVCFPSSGLQHLEIESMHTDKKHRQLIRDLKNVPDIRSWSDRYPALTHVTCTDPALIPHIPARTTYLCIKGAHSRMNVVSYHDLAAVLLQAHALTELVIDGASLRHASHHAPTLILPHLRALSLRTSRLSDQSVTADAQELAEALATLDAPALALLTIPARNDVLSARLDAVHVRIPSVTRFVVVPGWSWAFYPYHKVLPGVKELVAMGSDPGLSWTICLSGDEWPSLHTIDLMEMEPPSPQHLQAFSEKLHRYGRRRSEVGHGAQVVVRLPRGILPRDLTLNVSEFMDLRIA